MIVPFDLKSEQALGPAVLEHEHEDAVGRSDRQEVQDDRLDRHDKRTECKQQQQEGEREHEGDHIRQAGFHLLREVDILRRDAGDRCLDAREPAECRWDELVAQERDRLPARIVVARAGKWQLDRRRRAVGARRQGERRVGDSTRHGEPLEPGDRTQGGRLTVRRPGCDDHRRRSRARKLAPDPVERREHRDRPGRQRLTAGLTDVKRERRDREEQEEARSEDDRDDGAVEHAVDDRRPERRA